MLPGTSGFDVCRKIRAASVVLIVMLTALADAGDVVTVLELGADDYVTKPRSTDRFWAVAVAGLERVGWGGTPIGGLVVT